VLLSIPDIAMEVAVSPMMWRVVEANGVRTTAWVLPESGAGWHPNSAGAGADGNVVISGHQLLGDAPFAPIALGDVEVGQTILLTNANGDVFTYEVTEVTEPLPISNDPTAEQAIAQQYASQTQSATLTLISGWPDFSTTHRVIVVAELVDAG
jgi:sortase (surface protein transpeptidase)